MKKILIIEDQASLLEEIADLFHFEGYITITASNGLDGLDLAIRHLPDIILCDIMMPGKNGHDVLEALQQEKATRTIPFIFMTALAERENYRSGMALGADDYITKPFSWDELLKAVNSRLKKSDEQKSRTAAALDELRYNIILALPHELRTPLNGMMGFGQLLKDNPGEFNEDEIRDIGQSIYNSSTRLYRLIQNYLLYAQLELQRNKEVVASVFNNPEYYAENAAREMARQYKRNLDLVLDLKPGTIRISMTNFSKIIEEVVDNAFKFSHPGQKVTLSATADNEHYIIRVKDLGIGMKPHDIQKIGAYMQFDRKIYEQQGSGLGLIIARKLTEMHGGILEITSQEEGGSTVVLTFPMV